MDLSHAVTIERDEAAGQLAAYRTIKTPDAEERGIIAALVAACAGKPLVNLSDTIRAGGSFDDGCPHLAVMATSQAWCWVNRFTSGDVRFTGLA